MTDYEAQRVTIPGHDLLDVGVTALRVPELFPARGDVQVQRALAQAPVAHHFRGVSLGMPRGGHVRIGRPRLPQFRQGRSLALALRLQCLLVQLGSISAVEVPARRHLPGLIRVPAQVTDRGDRPTMRTLGGEILQPHLLPAGVS